MKINLQLKNFPEWIKIENTYVRGVAFHGDDVLREKEIGRLVGEMRGIEDFGNCLRKLNGFFSVVKIDGNTVFAGVDRVRSIPLFYGMKKDQFLLSDDANYIKEQLGETQYDELTEAEFLLTGYVTGEKTLFPGVKQLQAGELLVANLSKERWEVHTNRYYLFTSGEEFLEEKHILIQRLDHVVTSCMNRLIRWADGRPIILPLSGGYDSRIIAIMLKRLGYNNIRTFSYGRTGNDDTRVGQQVAKHLNLPLKFIPYSNQAWWEWFHSEEREEYYKMSHNFTSIPHLQDWPAVRELKKSGELPQDAVIVPGHTGDFVSGGHIPESFTKVKQITKEHFIKEVISNHYNLWDVSEVNEILFQKLQRGILTLTDIRDVNTPAHAADEFEKWEWQERQAKFIVNSTRVYEFWGYEWWMPLWDKEMMDFWKSVPLSYRIGRKLYIDYVTQQYGQIAKIPKGVAMVTNRDNFFRKTRSVLERRHCLNRNSRIFKLLREWYRKYKFWRKKSKDYETDKYAWLGIMDKKTYRSYHTGQQLVHSYVAKHILGRLKI